MRCVAVGSGKGGVGKTSVSAALALGLARKGNRVGLLDGDLTAPDVMEILDLEGTKVKADRLVKKLLPVDLGNGLLVYSISMQFDSDIGVNWSDADRQMELYRCLSDVQWGELDYLFVDLAPGNSPEARYLRENIKHEALVVVSPASMSLLDSSKLIRQLQKAKVPITGIVENLSEYACSCGRASSPFGRADTVKFASKYGLKHLGRLPFVVTDDGRALTALVNHPTIESICGMFEGERIPKWAELV